jgi:DNA-directed RNA polymerase subunit RPC12/RpoP
MGPEPDFLCQQCGHRATAEAFGLVVHCPNCNSRNVVLAEVWEKFRSENNNKQTCPSAEEAGSMRSVRDGSREGRR